MLPAPYEIVPFAATLVSLSLIPSVWPRLWERRVFRSLWAAALVVPSAALSAARGMEGDVLPAGREYLDLVALLSALYVISGGIALAGRLEGTPVVNTALIGIGAAVASLLGTPGAATLMIRPYLHANRRRRRCEHGVIFLIALAGNVGGCLLPIGDPPLYLGYLGGVPFFWTLSLFPAWLFVVGAGLAVFHLWDRRRFRREGFEGVDETRTLSTMRVLGLVNLPLLAAAIASAALIHGIARPAALAGCAFVSWAVTPRAVHERNRFSLAPVEEIAIVFFAIFGTISPALALLARASARLPFSPRGFFWTAGGLSALLDNAPTYLSATAAARALPVPPGAAVVAGVPEAILRAVSLGTVFFGALTYIGNGPNLLVRAIAAHHGVKMPGFAAYSAIAGAVFLPLFAVAALLFLGS